MEASFYEYTKSAQEIKKFKCEEKCREIAAEYERFNKENGVYEFFGEKLLEEAKENYCMDFSNRDIQNYLEEKRVKEPEGESIVAEKSWYDDSQDIRDVCTLFYTKNLRANYYWYTLWRIVKAYNGKNGCVITKTPISYNSGNTRLWIEVDWSKKSEEYVTGEKYKREARESWRLLPCAIFGAIVGCFTPVAIWIIMFIIGILCVDNPIENANNWIDLKRTIPFCTVVFCLIFSTILRKVMICQDIEQDSVEFNTHCKNIRETKSSYFDLGDGTVRNKFYD